MGQRVLAERGGRGGWRGIGRECGEGRGRLGAGGEELFTHPDPRFENPKVLFGKIPEINTLIRLEVECEFASIPG